MKIDDGKGRGRQMSVSESFRGNVSAKTNPRSFFASRDQGLTFTFTSIDTGAAAGDFFIYLKNTSPTKNIFVKEITFGSEYAAVIKLWEVTGTAAGTPLTPTNLNLSSGRDAEALGVGNGAVTGLTTGRLIGILRTQIGGHEHEQLEDALILGPNTSIAAEYDAGTTGQVEAVIHFHYEDVEREN
jgi:hypothetical protein